MPLTGEHARFKPLVVHLALGKVDDLRLRSLVAGLRRSDWTEGRAHHREMGTSFVERARVVVGERACLRACLFLTAPRLLLTTDSLLPICHSLSLILSLVPSHKHPPLFHLNPPQLKPPTPLGLLLLRYLLPCLRQETFEASPTEFYTTHTTIHDEAFGCGHGRDGGDGACGCDARKAGGQGEHVVRENPCG